MQVTVTKEDGLRREMEITLPAKDIDTRVEKRLTEIGKSLRIPGFRPGKAPMTIVKQKYGKAIMGEVLELAVDESTRTALEERNLKPAMQPKIEVKSFDDGKDLTYTIALEVLPEFKIGELKGIKLNKLVATPTDKDLEEGLVRIAEMQNRTRPIETPRGAQDGDTLVIDFAGRTADDNVAHEGMQAQDHQLKLGSKSFIEGFEAQLIGAKAGEKVEVKVSFPKNYGATELAGRDAIFDVTIKEIREADDSKVDDEFAKSFGLENLDELKKRVGEELQKEFDFHSRMYLKKNLMDALDASHTFEIPPGMLEIEHKNILQHAENEAKRGGEKSPADMSEDEKAELKSIAERRVKLGLLLAEIGRANTITVSEQELQMAVVNEARRYPGRERQMFDMIANNRNALESIRAPLFEDKVVDFILALAEIDTKTVTADELKNAIEAEEEILKGKAEKPKAKAAKKK